MFPRSSSKSETHQLYRSDHPTSHASSPAHDLDWEIQAGKTYRPHGPSRRDSQDRRSHDLQSSNLLVTQSRSVNARSRSPSLENLSSSLSSTKHSTRESREQALSMKIQRSVPASQSSSEDLLSEISPRGPFDSALLNKSGSRSARRGPWFPDEDATLLHLVRTQGPNNWARISHHMRHRSPMQCRERYHQNLKPSLNHEPISPQEGELIEQLVGEGGKRWVEIARPLGNRKRDGVKNWWNSSMNRKTTSVQQGSGTKSVGYREEPAAAIQSESTFYSEGEESFVLDPSSPPEVNFEHDNNLDKAMAEIVQGLVKDFLLLSKALATDSPEHSQHPPTSSGTASHRLTSPTSTSGTTSLTSISQVNGSRRSDDDDIGDEHRQHKRPRFVEVEPDPPSSKKLLACPYAKHDPERYSERNTNRSETAYHKCASKILTDIPRLKQHLYRVHKRPEYTCSSCFACFENAQSRTSHERTRSCGILECPFEEKMNPDQYRAVKRRQVGQDCVASWFAIFAILFPGAPLPDNPYVECTETLMIGRIVGEFTNFVEHEAPRRLAETMGVHIFGVGNQGEHQWWLNQVLEESLPTVLAEIRRQFQILTETQVAGRTTIRTTDSRPEC